MAAIIFEIFPAIIAVSGLAFFALWISMTFKFPFRRDALWYDVTLGIVSMLLPVAGAIITGNNLGNEWTRSVGPYQAAIVWMGVAVSMIVQSFLAHRRRWKKK